MKKLLILFLLVLSTTTFAKAPAKLRYQIDFLVTKILEKKRLTKNDKILMPTFYYASKTPLKQFQDAVEEQWGTRPNVITNAYVVKNNEIYILDDAKYYETHQRCMDDSVVHELVHYVQVKYLNWDLTDESLEWDAVEIQTEFRLEFCKN